MMVAFPLIWLFDFFDYVNGRLSSSVSLSSFIVSTLLAVGLKRMGLENMI